MDSIIIIMTAKLIKTIMKTVLLTIIITIIIAIIYYYRYIFYYLFTNIWNVRTSYKKLCQSSSVSQHQQAPARHPSGLASDTDTGTLKTCQHMKHTSKASWIFCRLKKSSLMAWQLNPQLYLLGAAPKCTAAKAKLSPLQNVMCTTAGYMDHMSSVNVGLLLALNECQHQFANNKWNCSSVEQETMLEGIKDIEGWL